MKDSERIAQLERAIAALEVRLIGAEARIAAAEARIPATIITFPVHGNTPTWQNCPHCYLPPGQCRGHNICATTS